MSKVSDYETKAPAKTKATVADLQVDVQRLHDEVCQLQNTPGNVTKEDEMLIDAIQGKVEDILAKVGELQH